MSNELVDLRRALGSFVVATETQSQSHIKPLHWHIAERLVTEGGFPPDDIVPRPPLRVETRGTGHNCPHRLLYDSDVAQAGEQVILGGLKTKQVDVVVAKKGIGPCIAISVKGSLNAFRNLTNRMEEAVGDCTNLHISYPALVYGFLHVLRANREEDVQDRNDIAVLGSGDVAPGIVRYHDVMSRLTGRRDVRDDPTRYESVSLVLVTLAEQGRGEVLSTYPPSDSPLAFADFFSNLYRTYDLRFVYAAPALEGLTRRLEWEADSPALARLEATAGWPRLRSSP